MIKTAPLTLWRAPATALGIALVSAPFGLAQDTEDEEIYTLSPFTVDASEQSGYRATSTLAGTRLKTSLKDIGAAIQVATAEFLEDTGSTNVEELFTYTTGTEVGGAVGNFAGSGAAAGNVSENNQTGRANPIGNSRVRGVSRASATRDFFLTPSWIGFDSYNTDSVTISRGPNSILFGIGEPGGIVDNAVKKAHYGKDTNKVSVRFGSRGSYRGTIDMNRVLIEDRLALRLNAMYEKTNYRQEPAYEDDNRFHAALSAKLFKNENVEWLDETEFEAAYETARVRGTPVDTMPMFDAYSHWWNAPGSQEIYEITGKKGRDNWEGDWNNWQANWATQFVNDRVGGTGTTPEGYNIQSQPELWGSYPIVYDASILTGQPNIGYRTGKFADVAVLQSATGSFYNSEGLRTPGWFPFYVPHQFGPLEPWKGFGWKRQVIMDKDIYNWEEMLIQGRSQYVNHDFDSHTATIRQGFFNHKAGLELAFDKQDYSNERSFPMGRHHYSAVKMDISVYTPNGERNPNLGRPLLAGVFDGINHHSNVYETKRATGYYELDFTESDGWTRHFGKHTFTGLKSEWEREGMGYTDRWGWNAFDDPDQEYTRDPASWGGQMFFMTYIGPSNLNVSDPSDLQLYQRPGNFQVPVVGQQYTNYYLHKGGSAETNEIRIGTITAEQNVVGYNRTRQKVDSEGITLQSRWLDNHLVTTYGWRSDNARTWNTKEVKGTDRTSRASNVELTMDNWHNGPTVGRPEGAPETLPWLEGPVPTLAEKGQTRTAQAVLHIPAKWTEGLPLSPEFSMHYSESENFNPSATRRNVFNEVIPSPSGETEEKGFSVSLAEDKVNLRFNWYETSSKGVKNTNISGSLWAFHWPRGWAERWLQAKNQYEKSLEDPNSTGRSFEESGWGSTDNPNTEFYEGATGPFNSFDEAINFFAFEVLPDTTLDAFDITIDGPLGEQKLNHKGINNLDSVADVISEGFEFEATVNPTRNWRISFNASKTESTFGNGLHELFRFRDHIEGVLDGFGDQIWDMYEGGAAHPNIIRNRWLEATNPLASAATKEGTVSTEIRKWRWNLVTNYSFDEGFLKGAGIGGSIRWQDDVALGYPIEQDEVGNFVPILSQPFMGGQDYRGDIWLSYKTKLKEDKYPIKFQVNFQNILGDDDPIPVAINPDGELAIIRASPEKRVFFTTTLEF